MAEYPALEIAFLPPHDPALAERLYALLDDFEPTAIHDDELNDVWRVFFRAAAVRDAARSALTSLPGVRTAAISVADEDWARRSQEGLKAISAGGLTVAPPWDVPRDSGRPVIMIEPSTGFGTGHHATTRLCLLLLQRLDLRGARVLDIGTGSGVLALAAWKLGAADVVAIDHDPDALDNARENIARNGAAAAIDIIQDDLASLRIERADVVLGNLTGAVLVRYADELRGLLTEHGCLLLSGFAPDDLTLVQSAFAGLTVVQSLAEGEWGAVLLARGRPRATESPRSQ
ncbi:MAG TPA: 50S ribosomal protein L11 methyltransferase [Vicinamibacterales bacterium]|nr:50S ribosomal protein L11 methyltransferase [Vicinamibacterales bacterium]